MSAHIVYRDCPGKPRQYIARLSHVWAVWHTDIARAQRFSQCDAEKWAHVFHRRTETHEQGHPFALEPPGHYSTQETNDERKI